MREVVLSVDLPTNWVGNVLQHHNADIAILDCKPFNGGGIQQLVEINADPESLDAILNDIKSDKSVKDAFVVKTKRGRMLGAVLSENSPICETVMSLNCFCRTCVFAKGASNDDGSIDWTLAFSGRDSLRALLDNLNQAGVKAKVSRLSKIEDTNVLTFRQKQILVSALEAGFFDYPRKTDLRALSEKVGVSSSTLSEILRRAVKKIIEGHVKAQKQSLRATPIVSR